MKILDFGQTMRQYRKKKGMTQEQLADCLGVQPKYISLLENGWRNPGPELQKQMEELILSDELDSALSAQNHLLTEEELAIQLRFYLSLCRLRPARREAALKIVYQVLDTMAKL